MILTRIYPLTLKNKEVEHVKIAAFVVPHGISSYLLNSEKLSCWVELNKGFYRGSFAEGLSYMGFSCTKVLLHVGSAKRV